jgi:hypothetical protein
MNLTDFILEISNRAFDNESIYFNGGHNGPYNDSETPVRNKGHWLIIFSKCFELTGKQIYLDTVRKLAEYLVSKESRPYGYSFHHRLKEVKDKCNGLIGQAWTFEALACASSILGEPQYSEVAEEVFFQHNFNENFGLWNRLEIDGEILSIDDTFNHQLWFAACAALLNTPRQEGISDRIFQFMNCLPENLSVLDNGLIYHPIERNLNQNSSRLFTKSKLRNIMKSFLPSLGSRKSQSNYNNKDYREKMINKSVGYHQFNMYAFGILKESLSEHPFWESSEFKQTVKFLLSDEFKNGLSDNIYGFPYNPPGFEIPYALSVLTDISESELVEISSWWVNEQFRRCYNPETRMMDRNTEDSLTHTARIYELANLSNSILEKIEVQI